jgi:predicted ATPase
MSDSTFLTRVVLENYKSIAACDVRLGPLTFLAGPNGAGKSNFLDALHFVSDALTGPLDQAIRTRGGSRQLFHQPAGPAADLGVRLEFVLPSGQAGRYFFRIGHVKVNSWPARWEVLEEECRLDSAAGESNFQVRGGQVVNGPAGGLEVHRDRLYLVAAAALPQFRPVYDALSEMRFYQFLPRSIPDIDAFVLDPALREDGSNLARVLAVLQTARPEAVARIEAFLRLVLPGLAKVSVNPVHVEGEKEEKVEKIALVFQQRLDHSAGLFGPSQMSEGTLRALSVLVALYQVEPYQQRRPSLVGIEDVEAALHPATLAVLFDALDEAGLTTQVIVTTQSPDLLDNKELNPETILAVTAAQGRTEIGRLDEACRDVLARGRLTAGELLRIGQLAPEVPAGQRPGTLQPA